MDKPSEQISGFLDFLRECNMAYRIALANEEEANQKIQDLLHTLELDSPGYHDGAKLARMIASVRKDRRAAKDEIVKLQAIISWIELYDKTIHSLEKLLGEVRKAEKSTEGRTYTPRTDVVKRALGGDGDGR